MIVDLAVQAVRPTPDRPPAAFHVGRPMHATKFETRKVNGKWILVPVKYAPGKGDPRLTPKVSYTPFP